MSQDGSGTPVEGTAEAEDRDLERFMDLLRGRKAEEALAFAQSLPASPTSARWCAIALHTLERWDELAEALRTADLPPDALHSMAADVILRGRRAYQLEADEKEALAREFNALLALDNLHPWAFSQIIQHYHSLSGELSVEWSDLLERAVAEWPDQWDFNFRLARDISHRERDRGLAIINRWTGGAHAVDALCLLAEVEKSADRYSDAARALERARKIEPGLDLPRGLLALLWALGGEPPPTKADGASLPPRAALFSSALLADVARDPAGMATLLRELAEAAAETDGPALSFSLHSGERAFYFDFDRELMERLAAWSSAVAASFPELAACLRGSAALIQGRGTQADLTAEILDACAAPVFAAKLCETLLSEDRNAEAVAVLVRAAREDPAHPSVRRAAEATTYALCWASPEEGPDDATVEALVAGRDALAAVAANLLKGAEDALRYQPQEDRHAGRGMRCSSIFEAIAAAVPPGAGRNTLLYQAGWNAHEVDPAAAARFYRTLLREKPDHPGALQNLLHLIQHDLDAREAAEVSARLDSVLRTPDTARWKASHEERASFQRTALARWPEIDAMKRRILAAARLTDRFSMQELARNTGMDVAWAQRHWKKLVETGMILESADAKTFIINPAIAGLVDRENTHAVALRIVRGGGTSRIKPVFNSRNEHEVYRILLQAFPNMLVFPNVSLQAIMQFDAMKKALSPSDFSYYLMASADFGIVSTATYLPICCLELDSVWHDTEKRKAKDAEKDRIFEAAGVPLVRLRRHGHVAGDALQGEILAELRRLPEALAQVEAQNPFAGRALAELREALGSGKTETPPGG